jgi:serine/threonine protein kinase
LDAKQARSVLREKEMLALLHHPFILHLVSSFQDENNLYLVLPVIQGGELFSVVAQKKHGLTVFEAAFYGAGIIEALGHFHHRYIAYRDLVRLTFAVSRRDPKEYEICPSNEPACFKF